jgi:hypothetical protein
MPYSATLSHKRSACSGRCAVANSLQSVPAGYRARSVWRRGGITYVVLCDVQGLGRQTCAHRRCTRRGAILFMHADCHAPLATELRSGTCLDSVSGSVRQALSCCLHYSSDLVRNSLRSYCAGADCAEAGGATGREPSGADQGQRRRQLHWHLYGQRPWQLRGE